MAAHADGLGLEAEWYLDPGVWIGSVTAILTGAMCAVGAVLLGRGTFALWFMLTVRIKRDKGCIGCL